MNDNQQNSNEQPREEYSAPVYGRFVFETSDLTQASGDGGLGSYQEDAGGIFEL